MNNRNPEPQYFNIDASFTNGAYVPSAGEPTGMVWCPMKSSGMAVMKCWELQQKLHCNVGPSHGGSGPQGGCPNALKKRQADELVSSSKFLVLSRVRKQKPETRNQKPGTKK